MAKKVKVSRKLVKLTVLSTTVLKEAIKLAKETSVTNTTLLLKLHSV